jgi:hypothetical protein
MTKGGFANGFFVAVPLNFIADLATVYSGLFSILNLFIFPDQQEAKSFQTQALGFKKQRLFKPFPSTFGIIPYSPFGPVHAEPVNINWQKMHSFWPKEIGLSSFLLLTLRFPPKRHSLSILVRNLLSGGSST